MHQGKHCDQVEMQVDQAVTLMVSDQQKSKYCDSTLWDYSESISSTVRTLTIECVRLREKVNCNHVDVISYKHRSSTHKDFVRDFGYSFSGSGCLPCPVSAFTVNKSAAHPEPYRTNQSIKMSFN